MTEQIKHQLNALKKSQEIRILLAVESGSRAWGFPSPDSDFDVRIIYIKKPNWYLSIRNRKDTINYFHGELLDINGWDIRKTLSLLKKSNATPFEWAQSPIVYEEETGFREKILNLAKAFFQPFHSLNHYKGIARNSYHLNPLSGEIKLKKLFYVIRPILAAKWIFMNKSIPPMEISHLMTIIEEASLKASIEDLIKIKAASNEDFSYVIDTEIKKFIDHEMDFLSHYDPPNKRDVPNSDVLDQYFRELLFNSSP